MDRGPCRPSAPEESAPSSFPFGERRPDEVPPSPAIPAWVRGLSVGLALFYPFAVYLALTHWRPRPFAFVALAFGLLLTALRCRHAAASPRELVPPLALAATAALTFLLDAPGLMLALPVAINLALLAVFGSSLYRGVPLVESLARLQRVDLTDAETLYCRRVTVVWCVFFVGNASIAAILALFAPLPWWTLYTGLISYGLVATLFAVEYSVRICLFPKARPFRRKDAETR